MSPRPISEASLLDMIFAADGTDRVTRLGRISSMNFGKAFDVPDARPKPGVSTVTGNLTAHLMAN